MFSECFALTELPDISKLDTSNVCDMGLIFNRCNKLSLLPDISKWNTNKVTDISICLQLAIPYHYYLIFQNGIQIM